MPSAQNMASRQLNTSLNDQSVEQLLDQLSPDTFQNWFRKRQHRHNIENGTPYFNGPSRIPPPTKHSPSSLLQCHRKILYRQCNAPSEQADPDGIFWFGRQFEEDVIFPFLARAVTGPNTYVRNTMWVDTTARTEAGEVQIKGATDPVIVDADSVPVLPTEVKTKSSIEHLDGPDRQHRAQVHAYLVGLSEKHDVELTDAVLLYASRKSLDLEVFHVKFDEEFWEEVVLEWASKHTQYRLDEDLPPAAPEYGWECKFCEYRERCGKGETNHSNEEPEGFLPLHVAYPREAVVDYLEAHEGAKVTPSLAHVYPEIASKYGCYDWHCTVCGETSPFDGIAWDGDPDNPPLCSRCGEQSIHAPLSGPSPEEQSMMREQANA